MQHSIAAKYAARPAARFVRPSPRARERRLGLRPAATFRPATRRATVLHDLDLSPLVRLRARWRIGRARPSLHRCGRSLHPVVVMRGPGSAPAAQPSTPAPAGVARLRNATATSAGGIVIRDQDGIPELVVGTPSARARRRDLDPAQGHPARRRDHRGRRRSARSAEETGLEVADRRPARLDRVLVRPARDAHPQDRATTS